MNRQLKYVVVNTDGLEAAIVFAPLLTHSIVAYKYSRDVVAAGFCYLYSDGSVTCFGESISLGIKSRGVEDAKLIEASFFTKEN